LLAALPIFKLFNRVLSDYPAARERLRVHAGKKITVEVGPTATRMRVSILGEMEMAGNDGDAAPDVTLRIPLRQVPALARSDEAAFSAVEFSGDSELAATLSTIARNVEWDVEEDLSKVMGDIAAHRVVATLKNTRAWQQQASGRLTENVAEYLTEERRAFITKPDLETLASSNETLRDDIARLEARVARISRPIAPNGSR
jgi:ubiquinone biosynthesis accessory factor UbiJ